MPKKEIATFAMGCFWGPESLFSKIPGVVKTEVGYMGGDETMFANPTYKQVCSNKTGYAEVVNIEFDNKKARYEDLLNVFWENHNPTTANRQGLNFGKQYRSAIFYHNEKQEKAALTSKKKAQNNFRKKIVTEIKKAGKFFRAEEYHQKYLEKRGRNFC